MNRKLVFLVALFYLPGCDTAPAPDLLVSTDTGADLVHDHQHLHGDPHRHDHQHEDDFRGSHSHGHSHDHRHAAAPHQGTIVSLRLIRGLAADSASRPANHDGPQVPASPHLEIVAESSERISIYFLSESADGQWETWETRAAEVTMEMEIGASETRLVFFRSKSAGAYWATLDDQTKALFAAESQEIMVSKLKIRLGELTLDTARDLMLSKSELDKGVN